MSQIADLKSFNYKAVSVNCTFGTEKIRINFYLEDLQKCISRYEVLYGGRESAKKNLILIAHGFPHYCEML